MNEFKFSALRQFGSENISFTVTIHSDHKTLSDKEIAEQIEHTGKVIEAEFRAVQEREIKEKELLAEASERRTAAVRKLDESLKNEMAAKKEAGKTLKEAERRSK